jgi:tetratricopeptide (TPR) repeat protein
MGCAAFPRLAGGVSLFHRPRPGPTGGGLPCLPLSPQSFMPPKSWAFFQPRGPDVKSVAGGEIEALLTRWTQGEADGGGDPQVANKLADLYVGAGRLKEAVRYYEFAMRSYLERGLFAQALAIGGKAESRCQGEVGLELYKLLVTAAVKRGVGPDLEARVTAFFSLAAAEQKMPLALEHTLQQLDEAKAGTPRLDLTLARWQLSLHDQTAAALRLYRRSYAYRRRGQEADADELYRSARETAPSLKPPEDTDGAADDGAGKSSIPWLVFNAEDSAPSSAPNTLSILTPRVRTPLERPAAPSPALEPIPETGTLSDGHAVAEGFQTFEPAHVGELPPAFEAAPLDEVLEASGEETSDDDVRPSLEAVFGKPLAPPASSVAVFLDLGSAVRPRDESSDSAPEAETAGAVVEDTDFSLRARNSAQRPRLSRPSSHWRTGSRPRAPRPRQRSPLVRLLTAP